MKTKPEKSAAVITIHDAPKMSKRGRNAIADWMERQAQFLRNNAKQLNHRFRARYIYVLMVALTLIVLAPGCKYFSGATSTPEAVTFTSFKDVWDASYTAYFEFEKRVVQGKVSKADEAKADNAWNLFRASYKAAFKTANMSNGAPAPDDLLQAKSGLIKLLTTL